jgi:cytochrome c-type biogenesis protein CcmH
MFYLGAAVLLLGAAGTLLWALLRPVGQGAPRQRREDTVRALYQDRLQELKAEADARGVSDADREAMEAELGAVLLAEYREQVGEASGARRGSPALIAGSVLVVLALSVGIYAIVGDPGADELAGARHVMMLDPHTQSEEIALWRDRLAARVAARPGEAESWYMLGHTELLLGDYQQAAEAFAVAHAQVGPDPGLDLAWLQARYMAAGGVMDAQTREIAERVLDRDPGQPLVLELFALDAFRQSDFREAVSLLNRALSAPLGDTQRASLQSGLDEARKRLGELKPSIDVAVSASPAPPSRATLFVIARPVGGGMPYAVVRRPAPALPLTVRLDDAVSMNPAAALSKAGEVEVVVRLSLTGAPMSHPGDWEWHSDPIRVADLPTPLRLNVELEPPPDAAGA